MTFSNDRTVELWLNLIPRIEGIKNKLNNDSFSLQIYDKSHFEILGTRYKTEISIVNKKYGYQLHQKMNPKLKPIK